MGRAVLGTVLAAVRMIQLRSFVIGVVVIALAVGRTPVPRTPTAAIKTNLRISIKSPPDNTHVSASSGG